MQEVNIVVSHFEIEKQADYHLVLALVFIIIIIIFIFIIIIFTEIRTYLRT